MNLLEVFFFKHKIKYKTFYNQTAAAWHTNLQLGIFKA